MLSRPAYTSSASKASDCLKPLATVRAASSAGITMATSVPTMRPARRWCRRPGSLASAREENWEVSPRSAPPAVFLSVGLAAAACGLESTFAP